MIGALKRALIFIHRWLGVSVCLLFLIWFPSAIGIMYWDFPSVSSADRLRRSPALDPSTVKLSPQEAYKKAADGVFDRGDVRLNTFDSRPVYRFQTGRNETVVYADTGERRTAVTADIMARAASAWTNQSIASARVEPVREVDQWTVQGQLRNSGPLWKYSWPDGQQVYVSGASGEIVQYTTTASRLGAYLGPIPHWFYFTPLRKHPPEWSAFVIWSSGIATIAALVGIIVGVWAYSPSKRYRLDGRPTSIPYRGYKRWHAVFGLIVGIGAVTWAFSGMLSMDPFPTPPRPSGRELQQALLGNFQLDAFERKHPSNALRQLGGLSVKELELTAFAGEPVYLAMLSDGDARVIPIDGEPFLDFDKQRVMDVVRTAVSSEGGADVRVLNQYDMYYLDRRRQLPLPVILAQLHDATKTRYYIDPKTTHIVGAYSSRNWLNRWAYHGLHSLDFPWLYSHRPLWDIVVITLMMGGTALSATSIVLAWRVVGRKIQVYFTTEDTENTESSIKSF